MVPSPLLDRASLERLERLAIRWEQSFNGLLGGNNLSRYAGVGHEFLDHRQFQRGDDLRAVNWRAYLRLERIFLKMFRTEPRTPVRVLLDCSESMACGAPEKGPGEAKFHYACRLTAALCYIGLVRLETVFVQPFGADLQEGFRADGGRHRYARAAHFLEGLSTSGRSEFFETVRLFLAPAPSPGLTIIVSDFLDESSCETALQHLSDYGHELLLLHVAGPDDRTPSWRGELELVDAESGNSRRINIDQRTADEHTTAYDEYCRRLEYAASRSGGRYIHLGTELPIEDTLYGSMTRAGSVSVQ